MPQRQFQRHKEDFICAHCAQEVIGNGYTNHCPKCLWSKHVDNNPGDRQAQCGGMMQPLQVQKKGGNYVLLHRCILCGFERAQRSVPEDSFEALLEIVRKSGNIGR